MNFEKKCKQKDKFTRISNVMFFVFPRANLSSW